MMLSGEKQNKKQTRNQNPNTFKEDSIETTVALKNKLPIKV